MTDDQPSQPVGGSRRAELIQGLLAEATARRERTIDDHMYAVARRGPHPATFRLQLFTAPRARPVAVVIQKAGEGAGLINEGERYAEAVWQRHCPAEPRPPVWIERFLLPSHNHDDFTVVTFPVTGHYRLGPPDRRIRVTEQEIAQLIGAPFDVDRGSEFRPRMPDPEPEPRYEVAWVACLPRPEPFRNPQCMPPGAPWWRWAPRQIIPSRRGRACCWMHRGSWHQVSRTAIALVRQAQCAGVTGDDIYEHVRAQARVAGITGWQLSALDALVRYGDGIQVETYEDGSRFYINGQHKTRAMLDQGVRRTLVIRWMDPEP
jgi:hypothetical protein